ncbi:Ig-like domain-containing protein, partial [Patescibacteria group bacterium]|nr:Ig-like domain-containing protein [Patescibacteria group bacterium]
VIAAGLSFGSVTPALAFGGSGTALGGNAAIDYAYRYSGGAYTDVTGAANNTTANDVTVGATAANDVLYIGMKSPFDTLYLDVGTWGAGAAGTLKYEYVSGALFGANIYKTLAVTSPDSDTNLKTSVSSGQTSVTFARPQDWYASGVVNGQTAYWIKITTTGVYSTAVKANQLKVRAYNVRLAIGFEFTNDLFDLSLTPMLDTCGSHINLGENVWGSGGIHEYALRTDGGNCTLVFEATAWHAPGQVTLTNLTSQQQDITASPVLIKQTTKMIVSDELGNTISDAVVTATTNNVPTSLGYFAPYSFGTFKNPVTLRIVRGGYVTQDGTSGNTGFTNFSTLKKETILSVTGPQTEPCTTIVAGQMNTCAALQLDTHVTVETAGGTPISGASVSFLHPGNSAVYDDLAKNPGVGDATGTTDASGMVKMALHSAPLDLKVSASGYITKTTAVTITDGVLNDLVVTLVPFIVNLPILDTNPSASVSTIVVSPATVTADGTSASMVTVTVKNAQGQGLVGKTVTLGATLSGVTVTPSSATTDASGIATFGLTSTNAGTVSVTASASGMAISETASVQFTTTPVVPPPVEQGVLCQQSITSGALLKLPDDADPNTQTDTAVYYIGTDCKRHAFPNSKVYFSWYADFSGVTTVPGTTMSAFSLGKNVTYRPGSKMVKFQSLNSVYVVAKGSVLRWVKTEAAASGLYGADWNKKVDDISDAFFTNYAFGTDVNAAADFVPATEQAMTPSISDNF